MLLFWGAGEDGEAAVEEGGIYPVFFPGAVIQSGERYWKGTKCVMYLIAGNFCSLLAMLVDSFSASRRTPKGVLLVQSVGQVFYCLSSMILGGYSACVQNVVSLIRNMVAIRDIRKKWIEWSLVIAGVVFGLLFNNIGVVGLLPVVANLEYTLAVFRSPDNERALKVAFLINASLFAVFNVALWNFVGLLSNVIVVVVIILYFIRSHRRMKQKRESARE